MPMSTTASGIFSLLPGLTAALCMDAFCCATDSNYILVPVQELVSLLIQHKCPLEAHTQRLAACVPLS